MLGQRLTRTGIIQNRLASVEIKLRNYCFLCTVGNVSPVSHFSFIYILLYNVRNNTSVLFSSVVTIPKFELTADAALTSGSSFNF